MRQLSRIRWGPVVVTLVACVGAALGLYTAMVLQSAVNSLTHAVRSTTSISAAVGELCSDGGLVLRVTMEGSRATGVELQGAMASVTVSAPSVSAPGRGLGTGASATLHIRGEVCVYVCECECVSVSV